MPIAVNSNGDALYLDSASNQWKPAKTAVHQDTGEKVAFDGQSWQPIKAPVPPRTGPPASSGPDFGPRRGTFEGTLDDVRKKTIPAVADAVVQGGKNAIDAATLPIRLGVTLMNGATGGQMPNGKLSLEELQDPVRAAQGTAGMALGALGGGGEAGALDQAATKAAPGAEAFARAGINLKGASTPDAIQDVLKAGVANQTGKVRAALPATPGADVSAQSANVGAGLEEKFSALKDLERQRWEHTRTLGEGIDATGVSNIDALRDIVGQDASNLKNRVTGSVRDLQAQQLSDQGEILDLRQKVLDLKAEQMRGEEGEGPSALSEAQHELAQRRIQAAQDQLTHKERVYADRGEQIAHQQKMEAQTPKKGMPKEVRTAGDLINMKQELGKVKTSTMDDTQLRAHIAKVDEVKSALDEIAKDNKEFGKSYKTGNRLTMANAERYRGAAAKATGMDSKVVSTERRSDLPVVGKHAATNTQIQLGDIVKATNSKADIDYLAANMRPKAFQQFVSDKISTLLADAGSDAAKLRESRPLIDHMLNDNLGVKSKEIGRQLDNLQAVLDKLAPDQAGISLEMQPELYRGKNSSVGRALDGVKAAMGTVFKHGKVGAFEISKAGEALQQSGSAEAKRLLALRKEMSAGRPKPPINLTGPAVGAFLGGSRGTGGQ